jgi:hypothetical protein
MKIKSHNHLQCPNCKKEFNGFITQFVSHNINGFIPTVELCKNCLHLNIIIPNDNYAPNEFDVYDGGEISYLIKGVLSRVKILDIEMRK